MPDCLSIDRLVTPYVDGELAGVDRSIVDGHLRACGACRSRVAAERRMREVLGAHRPRLRSEPAPGRLHARCGRIGALGAGTGPASRTRVLRLAVAAAVVLLVGGAALHRLTQASVRVTAAELAIDHVKCAIVNAVAGTRHDHTETERALAAAFAWNASLPDRPEQAGLELVGSRACLYGEGRIAHIMYRHAGRLVSVFMLPGTERPEGVLDVLGHREAVWTSAGRTFVLVAREPHQDVERLASFVRGALR